MIKFSIKLSKTRNMLPPVLFLLT